METLTARGKVSEDAKLTLRVPDAFRGKTVDVEYRVTDISDGADDKEEWRRFVDSVYGSITDPAFERPPQGELPPIPNLDE